jgi:hypothetical protein
LKDQWILPEAIYDILDGVVTLVTKCFVVAEGIAIRLTSARQEIGDCLGGERPFLDRKKDSISENRIDEPVRITDTKKPLSGVVDYLIGKVRSGVNAFAECQVRQALR